MKTVYSLVIPFAILLLVGCSSTSKLETKSIGLINNISYLDSSFNNPNASNGFLVEYKHKTYGITAKHILMIAKTDKMEFADFQGELKEWKMHPKNDETSYVIMDKLLNLNRTDSLTWDYMYNNWENYNDWLVFSIKENNTNHVPLKFRGKPLEKGEIVNVIGWSYSDTTGSQRVYTYKYDNTNGNYHNLIQINGPKSLGGLSGSPIIDEQGKLIGLVTSGGEDEETGEIILEATNTKNMIEFISRLEE